MRAAAAVLVLAGMALASATPESGGPVPIPTGGGQDEKIHTNSYKGKAPPELEVAKENWVNAKDAVKLGKLKGRVVWLEFSFLG